MITTNPPTYPEGPADGSGCPIYGTVLRDGGAYRRWTRLWAFEFLA